MRKLGNKAGFTLMEMMVSLLILVLLVSGIGVGMDAGLKIYKEANFESSSATLSGIVNTAVGDMLRYAEDIKEINTVPDVEFVFTNREYGVADAYFYIGDGLESDLGTLYLKNTRSGNSDTVDLLSSGAYPELEIANFKLHYTAPNAEDNEGNKLRGGYFELEYDIISQKDRESSRHVESIVRHLNASSSVNAE